MLRSLPLRLVVVLTLALAGAVSFFAHEVYRDRDVVDFQNYPF